MRSLQFDEPVCSVLEQKGRAVWAVPPDSTVYHVVQMMSEKQVGALIVLDGGHLAGIVSERDYARKVILRGKNSHYTLVREIMTTPVLFTTLDQTVGECLNRMTTCRVRHLPIVDGDAVVGMISIGDLVNWIVTSQEETIRRLQNDIDRMHSG